jgi:phosphosulfolactate synthase
MKDLLQLPPRTPKRRTTGITAVTDLGLTTVELQALLDEYGDYLDIAKFGIGSAFLTPRLADKVRIYKEHGVIPYFGGTLFEKFYHQGAVDDYIGYLRKLGVEWLEISSGTVDLPLSVRIGLIRSLKGEFGILSEVGCKDAARIMPPSQWIEELQACLEAGASYVITEGRDSATAGLYRESGEIREGLLSDIIDSVDPARTIFEAPTHKTQMYFINKLGPEVNLGNVSTRDLLVLESQRRGLRYETFFVGEA